ncbi:hypothetical protein F4777DRAFT_547823 [Nemania sp. FL0916]|nr:hypothetical protein F4777DRAFT_547823 [Nemania sp. FL0916]
MKDRIKQWVKEKKQGPIAQEITTYVKRALTALPIPVPAIFINTVANVVIPPLVSFIMSKLGGNETDKAGEIAAGLVMMGYLGTPKNQKLLRDLDRDVLRLAGLPVSQFPAHLQNPEDTKGPQPVPLCHGQPDRRSATVSIKRFYQSDKPNGCHAMDLVQVIGAQTRFNPKSDEDPVLFGPKVWETIKEAEQKKLKSWAHEKPPNKHEIAGALYKPVYDILFKPPYSVPAPIQASFASMKVPEVTEWVVSTYKEN